MCLTNHLRERIAAQGQLSVADYMEACNTHYYATRDPFGTTGDFTTAPEISQIFGELIGAWLADTWVKIGSPKAVLCEVGPGRGTLMKDILRATRNVPQFHDSIRILMVETSPTLEALQKKTLHGGHTNIEWRNSLDSLPSLPLLMVGNEFLDALPVMQEVHTAQGWQARRVIWQNNAFAFTPAGERIRESCPAAKSVMQQVGTHIKRFSGAALFIDYGYDLITDVLGPPQARPEYPLQNILDPRVKPEDVTITGDTLQAVKRHAFTNPLEAPGEADLTAHVDFSALRAQAMELGLAAHYTTQGEFLRRLGAELRATALCKQAEPQQQKKILSGLERIAAPSQMGELFKVLCATSLVETPAGF